MRRGPEWPTQLDGTFMRGKRARLHTVNLGIAEHDPFGEPQASRSSPLPPAQGQRSPGNHQPL